MSALEYDRAEHFFPSVNAKCHIALSLCRDLVDVINKLKCICIRNFECLCTKFDFTRVLTRNLSSLRCYYIIVPPQARRFTSS